MHLECIRRLISIDRFVFRFGQYMFSTVHFLIEYIPTATGTIWNLHPYIVYYNMSIAQVLLKSLFCQSVTGVFLFLIPLDPGGWGGCTPIPPLLFAFYTKFSLGTNT